MMIDGPQKICKIETIFGSPKKTREGKREIKKIKKFVLLFLSQNLSCCTQLKYFLIYETNLIFIFIKKYSFFFERNTKSILKNNFLILIRLKALPYIYHVSYSKC